MENLQLSRSYFNVLARKMGNPLYPRDESLLRQLFVTPNAAAVFIELVTWLPYSKRTDGSIYKSDAQLARVIGCSTKTVERTRTIMRAAGFTIEVKKANGAPTNHYRFDLEAFITFAANKLEVKVEQMREWMFSTAEKKEAKSVSDTESKSEKTTTLNVEMVFDTESKSLSAQGENGFKHSVEMKSDTESISSTVLENTDIRDENQNRKETETSHSFQNSICQIRAEKGVGDLPLRMQRSYILGKLLKITCGIVEEWIHNYGYERVEEVTEYAFENQNHNDSAYFLARSALEQCRQVKKKALTITNGKNYTTGNHAYSAQI